MAENVNVNGDNKSDMEYTVKDKPAVVYYTAGMLRDAIKELPDDAPVVAAPLNDKIRVALDLAIAKEATIGDYSGSIAIFSVGLYDIETNKEINLVPKEE